MFLVNPLHLSIYKLFQWTWIYHENVSETLNMHFVLYIYTKLHSKQRKRYHQKPFLQNKQIFFTDSYLHISQSAWYKSWYNISFFGMFKFYLDQWLKLLNFFVYSASLSFRNECKYVINCTTWIWVHENYERIHVKQLI